MERIHSSYKLIEVLAGRRGSADTFVNVVTVEFKLGPLYCINDSHVRFSLGADP